jgi:hypothetical protein
LREPLPQGRHPEAERRAWGSLTFYELILILVGKLPSRSDDFVDQRGQVHGLGISLKLPGFNF